MTELGPEDAKLVTLARGASARAHVPHTGHREGAAVRDTDGRSYAAATVENRDARLTTSALRAAVAAAAASGARAFEAAVVVGDRGLPGPDDAAVLAEFGGATLVFAAGPTGTVTARSTAGELAGGRGEPLEEEVPA